MSLSEATETPETFESISTREAARDIYVSYRENEVYSRDLEFDLMETGMSIDEYLEELEDELQSVIGSNHYRKWTRNWAIASTVWGAASIASFSLDQPLLGLGMGGASLYGGKKAVSNYRRHRDFMEGEPEADEIMEALEVDEGETRLILEP
jgi:hypothetical protein